MLTCIVLISKMAGMSCLLVVGLKVAVLEPRWAAGEARRLLAMSGNLSADKGYGDRE